MIGRRYTVLALVVGVVMAGRSPAAEEPLVTDRPDFTESSSVVGSGVLQLESGLSHADFSAGEELTTVGEVLVRWGFSERLEARFLLPTYARETGPDGERSGFADTAVGCKVQISRGESRGLLGGMEASVIASTTVPTGSGDFAGSSWQPLAVFAAGWDLSPRNGLGVNLGIGRPVDDGRRYTTAWISTALGTNLTEPLSVFVELIAFNREEARGPETVTFQTGAVYLLSPDLQLDLRAARRLTESGPDMLVGAGISLRVGG